MDVSLLKTAGQIAGIGGLSLGVLLILFRDIIRKNIFPRLPPAEAYGLLRLITCAVWSIAVLGIFAWVYVSSPGRTQSSSGSASPNISGVGGDVKVKIDSN